MPFELKPTDVERRFCMSEMLLERYKKKSFLRRIVIGNEKWIYYDNPKLKKYGKPVKSTPKRNIHVNKVMLWWDQKGILYYERLPSGENVKRPLYRTQLNHLKRSLKEKRQTRQESVIFHHENAGHMQRFQSKTIWIIVDRKFCPTRLIVRTWRCPTITCFDRCRTLLLEYAALQSREPKIGSTCSRAQKMRNFFVSKLVNCQKDGKKLWVLMDNAWNKKYVTIFSQ